MMNRSWTWAVVLLFVMADFGYCGTLKPRPGWVTADHIDQAVAVAKKKNRIVCVLYAFRRGEGHETARNYMREKSLRGMVKVLLYVTARAPEPARKIMGQVRRPDAYLPVMYFATPDDLSILGFVQSGTSLANLRRVVALVKKVFAWRHKSSKEVARADKLVEGGRFKAARKIYEDVRDEDLKCAIAVTKTWNIILSKEEADGLYFPDLAGKIDELETKAEERLEQAQEHYDNGKYAKAGEMIEPMVKDAADFEAVEKAAELLEKVKEKLKSTKK